MPSLTCNSVRGSRPASAQSGDPVKSVAGESVGNSAALEEWDADGLPLKGAPPPGSPVKEGASPVGVSREGSPDAEVGGGGAAGGEEGSAVASPEEESLHGGEGVDAFVREESPGGVAAVIEENPVPSNMSAVPSSRKGRGRFGTVVTVRMGDRKALERIAMALSFGEILILQDLGEEIDSALVLPCSPHPLANMPFLPPTWEYSLPATHLQIYPSTHPLANIPFLPPT